MQRKNIYKRQCYLQNRYTSYIHTHTIHACKTQSYIQKHTPTNTKYVISPKHDGIQM